MMICSTTHAHTRMIIALHGVVKENGFLAKTIITSKYDVDGHAGRFVRWVAVEFYLHGSLPRLRNHARRYDGTTMCFYANYILCVRCSRPPGRRLDELRSEWKTLRGALSHVCRTRINIYTALF